jgi:Xaa-Pro aminopeptidase
LPHGTPTEKRLKNRELIVIDFGAIYNGYCSDLTKTIGLGIMAEPFKKTYKTIYNAQQEAIKFVKDGVRLSDIDKKARELLEKSGMSYFFTHGVGHGIGMLVHEPPKLIPDTKGNALKNMVFTIEPGIYIPGKYGIRIENMVIPNQNGCTVLGKDQKEMIII